MNWRRLFFIRSIALVCIGLIIAAEANAAGPSRQDLVRSVQSELKRVGCFSGPIDGNWNAASQRSLDMFNKRAGTKFDVKLASIDMLKAIREQTSRICLEANAKTAQKAPSDAIGTKTEEEARIKADEARTAKEATELKAANEAAAKAAGWLREQLRTRPAVEPHTEAGVPAKPAPGAEPGPRRPPPPPAAPEARPMVQASAKPAQVDPVDACRERLLRLGIHVANEPCVDVGEIVNNLARGTYSFNKPKAVNLGEAFPIRLVLQTGAGQTVSFEGLPGNVERREDKPFAQSVEATLTGDDFEITPAGPQGRTATFAQPVEWDWKLKPTSPGTKSLTIEVTANIFVRADKHRVQITTLREFIEIEVTVFQRLKAYVADASGLVIAAAALATPLAALIGFVPKVRTFFVDEVLRLWRRRNRRVNRT